MVARSWLVDHQHPCRRRAGPWHMLEETQLFLRKIEFHFSNEPGAKKGAPGEFIDTRIRPPCAVDMFDMFHSYRRAGGQARVPACIRGDCGSWGDIPLQKCSIVFPTCMLELSSSPGKKRNWRDAHYRKSRAAGLFPWREARPRRVMPNVNAKLFCAHKNRNDRSEASERLERSSARAPAHVGLLPP